MRKSDTGLLFGVAGIGLIAAVAILSGPAGLPFVLPLLLIAVPLLAGRRPGEELLLRLAARRRGLRPVRNRASRLRAPRAAFFPVRLGAAGAGPRAPPCLA